MSKTFQKRKRKGAILSIELVIALPILLIVIFGAVEFTFLLLSTQAITAGANVGARQAALPSATAEDVEDAVRQALASWRWSDSTDLQVIVYVDGEPEGPGNFLEDAPTGTPVQVTVKLEVTHEVAPDLLGILPALSVHGQELTASFVTRKE